MLVAVDVFRFHLQADKDGRMLRRKEGWGVGAVGGGDIFEGLLTEDLPFSLQDSHIH